MPRLARQRVDYLIHSMKEFRDNTRSGADTLMSNVVIGVSDDDLAALAHTQRRAKFNIPVAESDWCPMDGACATFYNRQQFKK